MTKEELIKEAKEWRNNLPYEIDNDTFNNIVIPCIEFGYNKCKEELNQEGLALQSDMDKTIEQNIALKKELNKANEWHYIKNGDYPKDTKTVLALCIVGGEPYPYLAQYWKGSTTAKKNGVDLNWNCWLNNMQREVVEPYAWKEIVLPKESE